MSIAYKIYPFLFNMFKKIWEHSLLYFLIEYTKFAIKFKSDKYEFGHMFYNGIFGVLAQKYLNIDLDKDWVGRLYGVINPNTDINGNFNPGTMIIEMDGENTNNNEYVNTWIYKQLKLMASIYSLKDMYEKITVDIKHVGPEDQDNYLVVFDFDSRQNKAKWRKKLLLRVAFWIIVAALAVISILIL